MSTSPNRKLFLRFAVIAVFLLGGFSAAAFVAAPETLSFAGLFAENEPKLLKIEKPIVKTPARTNVYQNVAGKTKSADGIWQETDKSNLENRIAEGVPSDARAVRLNSDLLKELLGKAPLETENRRDFDNSKTILELPLPDGGFARFRVAASPVMEKGLLERFPDILSFRAQGVDDPKMSARFDFSPRGFHATVLTGETIVSIHPARHDDAENYVVYLGENFAGQEFACGVDEKVRELNQKYEGLIVQDESTNVATGDQLRRYRIAIATTFEYTSDAALGGGSTASTVASLNTWLNAVNAVYERDLAVRLLLVDNTAVIYTTSADPYTGNDLNSLINQVQDDLQTKVGLTNYDVGHVLTTGAGGGLAAVGVVCNSGKIKGAGATSLNSPLGNAGSLKVFAHELGHMFGAPHSYNATCTAQSGQRSAATAYEVGSGTTIMSYNGICGADNLAAGNDFRFHSISLQNINAHLATTSCASNLATGNNVPTVDAGAGYTIPKFTPFTLTASGNDLNAADVPNLTYTWEQFDNGGSLFPNPPFTDTGDPAETTRPIFRALPATTSPTRTFPSLTYILNNQNDPPDTTPIIGEELPRVTRQVKFRVTVRDNRSGGGGTNEDNVTLNVDGNTGPFGITAPNTAISWTGGTSQTVTWNVNNTNLAPVNTANVKISLSTDGGSSFPIVLAATTPNDGTQSINVPNGIASNTARIKIEAVGNIYFDISDVNFTVVNGDACPVITSISPGAGNAGSTVTLNGTGFTGVTAVRFGGNVNAASFNVVSNTQITAVVPAGATTGAITLSENSCTDRQSSPFSICASAPTILNVDDGVAEGWSGNRYVVNRLTPLSYPATLTHVQLYFLNSNGNGLSAGNPIEVLAGANADGDSDINLTITQRVPTTVTAINTYVTYALPNPITINSGDFVVGFGVAMGINSFPASRDVTTPLASRSYASNDDGATFGLSASQDWMIRAQYSNNCVLPTTISPGSQNFNAAGGTGSISVSTNGAFTAVSNSPFITITSGTPGNNAGNVTFSVTANTTGAVRTGTITVAGQTFTVTQDACAVSFSPVVQAVPAGGGIFTANVFASPGCTWTAASISSFVTLNSGASGSGDGVINYTVAPLVNTTPRTGSLTINGQNLTINQAGCSTAPANLAIDDGSFESLTSARYAVNRLTPASYPATLTQVQIYFGSDGTNGIGAGANFNLQVGSNPDGDSNINGTISQTAAATVGTTNAYNTYTLTTPITINSGDFVVGYSVPGTTPTFPIPFDNSAPESPSRAYVSGNNGANFSQQTGQDFLIRANYTVTCTTGTSGTIDVGAGQTYTSLTRDEAGGLFKFLNSTTLTGDVTVNISSDLTNENGAVALNQLTESGAGGYKIKIQPSGGALRTISGASGTNGLIQLNGADRIEFDGLNTGGNSFLIRNTAANASTFAFYNDASSNQIKNAGVEGGNSSSSKAVIHLGTGATTGNDNNTITGNTVRNRSDAVAVTDYLIHSAASATVLNSNVTISGNQIFGFGATAIEADLGSVTNENWTISGNTIYQTTGISSLSTGINFNGAGTNSITNNVIRDLQGSSQNHAIRVYNSLTITVSRNRIYNLTNAGLIVGIVFGDGFNTSPAQAIVENNQITIVPAISANQTILALDSNGSGASNVFNARFNTVLIGGTATGTNLTAACAREGGNGSTSVWRSNVCWNNRTGGTGGHLAFYDPTGGNGTFTSDNNVFAGTGVTAANFMRRGATAITFAAWKTQSGQDANSSGSVASALITSVFNNVSNGDLNINAATGDSSTLALISNNGASVAGVTSDFGNADARNATRPDVGSDEFNLTAAMNGTTNTNNFVLNPADSVAVNGTVNITGALILNGGNVTGTGTLVVLNCAPNAVSGTTTTNYLRLKLQRCVNNTGIFEFPVGTASGFAPVTLQAVTGTGNVAVTPNQGAYPNTATGLPANRLQRWWNIENPGGGITQTNLVFGYQQANIVGTEGNYAAYRIPTGGGAATLFNGGTNAASNLIYANNVTQFSDWTAADTGAATAAEIAIGGRVSFADGNPIAKARVILTDENGNRRLVLTNAFGYFNFANVAAGASYVVQPSHRRFNFAPQFVSPTSSIDNLQFTAAP